MIDLSEMISIRMDLVSEKCIIIRDSIMDIISGNNHLLKISLESSYYFQRHLKNIKIPKEVQEIQRHPKIFKDVQRNPRNPKISKANLEEPRVPKIL